VLLSIAITRQILSGAWDPDVEDKTMVIFAMPDTIVTRAQGMFAEFLAVVGALHYGVVRGAAALRVEFRTPFYVDPARGPNWFAYFFEPTMVLNPSSPPQTPKTEVRYSAWLAHFGKLGSFSQVVTKGSAAAVPDPDFAMYPFPVTGALTLQRMRTLVQTYVKPLPSLVAAVDRIWSTELGLTSDDFVIGIHYRGLDKIDAYPFVPAPPDLFRATVDAVVATYKPARWRVYIATDTQDFVDWAVQIWGDRVAARNISRIHVRDIVYDVDGTPIPLHKTKSVPAYDRAEGAVVDMLVLARTRYIIKNRSSLSDTSLAFAPPATNYTFILGPDDPVYSSDTRIPRRMPFGEAAFMAQANAAAQAASMTNLRKSESSWWSSTFWWFFSIA
jgi:hypothetical protein